jgi:predicted  nucleic acid-binding Zn-ribbon protein
MEDPLTGRYVLDAAPITRRRVALVPSHQPKPSMTWKVPKVSKVWVTWFLGLLAMAWMAMEQWGLQQRYSQLRYEWQAVSLLRDGLREQLSAEEAESVALAKDKATLEQHMDTAGRQQRYLTAQLAQTQMQKAQAEAKHLKEMDEWQSYEQQVELTLNQTQAQLNNTSGALNTTLKAVKEKEHQVALIRQSAEAEVSSLNSQIRTTAQQRDQAATQASQLGSQLCSSRSEAHSLQGQLQTCRAEVSCLEGRVRQLECDKSSLQGEVSQKASRICQLESQLSAALAAQRR